MSPHKQRQNAVKGITIYNTNDLSGYNICTFVPSTIHLSPITPHVSAIDAIEPDDHDQNSSLSVVVDGMEWMLRSSKTAGDNLISGTLNSDRIVFTANSS